MSINPIPQPPADWCRILRGSSGHQVLAVVEPDADENDRFVCKISTRMRNLSATVGIGGFGSEDDARRCMEELTVARIDVLLKHSFLTEMDAACEDDAP